MSAPASSTLLGMLPIPRTRLIGRETERAAGRAFVAEETVPLSTLTGPAAVDGPGPDHAVGCLGKDSF